MILGYAFTMTKIKKERLYISQLLEDPAMSYPAYYLLSEAMRKNEMLLSTIESLHSFALDYYEAPKTYDDVFVMFDNGSFAIYKERYIVGFFGGKMMYLEPNGWRGMPITKDVFELDNWLVC